MLVFLIPKYMSSGSLLNWSSNTSEAVFSPIRPMAHLFPHCSLSCQLPWSAWLSRSFAVCPPCTFSCSVLPFTVFFLSLPQKAWLWQFFTYKMWSSQTRMLHCPWIPFPFYRVYKAVNSQKFKARRKKIPRIKHQQKPSIQQFNAWKLEVHLLHAKHMFFPWALATMLDSSIRSSLT